MNHINGPSMGQPSTVIQDEMLEDLHAELAHWTAVEADAVRDCHARQGGSTGAVPIAAPAAAQPPASALPAPAFGWPPGLVGRIAQALYAGAYSPVPDVAVAAAIALVNGVCGRAYRTYSGKDLAIYIILVAQSGIGKDAIHEGIPELIKLANVPRAETLLRQSDFASGEALHKRLLASPGFLYLQGEFGRKLKRMSNPSDTPMQNFRTTLTNAYGKSFMEGKEYSKEEDSKLGVAWPALSFLGETTPSTFLECLTPDMMEDGFMSRFLTVQCSSKKPIPREGQRMYQLSEHDLMLWRNLLTHCEQFQDIYRTDAPRVEASQDAYNLLRKFELDCIDKVNASSSEYERQSWHRAALKAMKIGSALAAADNFACPLMTAAHAEWALQFVQADIDAFQKRHDSGDIGTDDHARERKVLEVCKRFLSQEGVSERYQKSFESMRLNSIVPRAYLQTMTQKLTPFTSHKQGATSALDATLRSLIANGYLMEVEKSKVSESYVYQGKAYRVIQFDFSKQREDAVQALRWWKD